MGFFGHCSRGEMNKWVSVKDAQIPRSFMVAICTVIEPWLGFGAVMNVLFEVCVLKDIPGPSAPPFFP